MDSPNCQTTIPKRLINQPISCPWMSSAPLGYSATVRHGQNPSEQQTNNGNLPQNSLNCQHTAINQSCFNNHQMNVNPLINIPKPSTSMPCPSIHQSSRQFFHFLRLMQLFPDVHPATLHTVLVLCKNDFFCAVDKLLYAKKCKQLYNTRRNMLQACNTNSKFNRHQSYCYVRPTVINNSTSDSGETSQNGNGCVQSPVVMQNFGQIAPLDVSLKKLPNNKEQATATYCRKNETGLKVKINAPRKIVPRNRMKSKVPLPNSATDLPPVASPQCKLPIRPLSPITGLPEDLSSQSISRDIS